MEYVGANFLEPPFLIEVNRSGIFLPDAQPDAVTATLSRFVDGCLHQLFSYSLADIFLQDPYGTYRHRVSEYAPRLFFVVGGNDPIVPARSVLDTSPPDGINMLESRNSRILLPRNAAKSGRTSGYRRFHTS